VKRPVKVLIVEDSEDDAKLELRALRRGGFEPTHRRVQSAREVTQALADEPWDAVISDFSMPGFTGLDALAILRSTGLDIPFILVSGTIGEELAVNAMKVGASDYLMKDSLERLAPALERELKDAKARADNRVTQEALAESDLRFRQMAANIRDVFLLIDADTGRVLYASPAYEEIWGRSCESLYENPDSWFESIHPGDRESTAGHYKNALATGRFQFDCRIVRPDDTIRWMEVRGFPVRDDTGRLTRIAAIVADVTERANSEERIRRLNRVYAMLSSINALIVRVSDRDELFREACRIAVEQGRFQMAWVGLVDPSNGTVTPTASAGMPDDFFALVRQRFSQAGDPSLGASLVSKAIGSRKAAFSNDLGDAAGLPFKEELVKLGTNSLVVLPLQIAEDVVGVFTLFAQEADFFDEQELKLLAQLAGDIAYAIDHIAKQALLDYLAYYDVLTGLANRRLFLERLAPYKRSAVSGGHKLAVYLMDLERFKNTNDSLGRTAGDLLLRQVAEWLTAHTGDANLVARIGADQFAIVLPEAKGAEDAARLLDKTIKEFLEHPFVVNDVVLRVAVKVGVALFPDDGASAEILFKNAEVALKKAKASGDRYLFYTQKMTDAVSGMLTLENQLRQALDNGEFVLHYQPKVSLATGALTSAEALIRWNDPRTGLVPPGRFIPILEQTGLIHEVGRWALRTALGVYLRWRTEGRAAVRIAVNVSPQQLRHRDFVAEVQQAIGFDTRAAAGLELEITESVVMEDIERSIATLKSIRAMGVTIAIDDFGTGFSSLSYLARLPVDALKIDRSFVVDMTTVPTGLALVSTIINLAHALKLKVVAEGVETEEQARLLRLARCDEMQGYLFSKPVPLETFEAQFLAPASGRVPEPST
jgi:diguanylate cyclase (GGDEF)-like protein/PAS domain S-box-containing protein